MQRTVLHLGICLLTYSTPSLLKHLVCLATTFKQGTVILGSTALQSACTSHTVHGLSTPESQVNWFRPGQLVDVNIARCVTALTF